MALDDGPVPLDDVLDMARVAGEALARAEAERSYRLLMRKVRRASADWKLSEPAKAACLGIYSESFKRQLGLKGAR